MRKGELRQQLIERLRATPGVVAVSEANQQPLSGNMRNTGVTLPEQTSGQPYEARFNFISPEYFDALSIPLLRGRSFTTQEAGARAPVAVISEATARRYWPGLDPIGRRLGVAAANQPGDNHDESKATISYPQFEVIGVARDTRSRWVWEKDETFIYLPLPPRGPSGQYLIVRTQGDPANVMGSVRKLGAEIDPSLRTSVRRIDEGLAFQMAPFR